MPSRNSLKEFAPNQYYHLYNRGVEKRNIFIDEKDYLVFLGLIKKYLTGINNSEINRHSFENLSEKIEVLAYCLMPNHFHILARQNDADSITRFMRRVITGYAMYFNNRYDRVGPLFQGRYKASLINADAYLHHISRYIHLNPEGYKVWPYSSLPYYMGRKHAAWIHTKPILDLFKGSFKQYLEFIEDYEESKKELAELKWQLANDLSDL